MRGGSLRRPRRSIQCQLQAQRCSEAARSDSRALGRTAGLVHTRPCACPPPPAAPSPQERALLAVRGDIPFPEALPGEEEEPPLGAEEAVALRLL